MSLFWILIIVAAVILVKWLFSGFSRIGLSQEKSVLNNIFKERYGRGEIDKEEFEQ